MSTPVKLPRQTSMHVVLDSAKADAYVVARDALQKQEQELALSFPRRAAAVRASLPAGASTEECATALAHLRDADTTALAPARQVLADADTALELVREQWVFRSLGSRAWKQMVADHPATENDNAEWVASGGTGGAPYCFASIARALIKASVLTPSVTPDDVDEMFNGDDWSDAELVQLWTTAMIAQTQPCRDPKTR